MPRTGTASFTAALSRLLDGPVYHGATQMLTSGDEHHIKTLISCLSVMPYKSPEDKKFVLKELRDLLDGYVAATDSPLGQMVPELMELYPNAKVICTVRDPDAWAKSMGNLGGTALQTMLAFMVFWVPCARWFPRWVDRLIGGRWGELYIRPGDKTAYDAAIYQRHLDWLKRIVPAEKLIYYDVRDGWGPLCEALKVPVPVGVEFPKVNDGKAMDAFANKTIANGLIRWAGVLSIVAVVATVVWRFR